MKYILVMMTVIYSILVVSTGVMYVRIIMMDRDLARKFRRLIVSTNQEEIMTKTAVPIVVDWTARICIDMDNIDRLRFTPYCFKSIGRDERIEEFTNDYVRITLAGIVCDAVASMTPEEILADKEAFKKKVQESMDDEMSKTGLLVSFNIQDITDRNGYLDNIAFLDESEEKKAA